MPRLVQELGLSCGSDDLLAHYDTALDHAQAMAHAHEVLRELRGRGIRISVVANGWVEAQTRCMSVCGLTDLADDVVISKGVGFSKPDPRIYVLALERLGVSAAEAWFVGDSPLNDVWGPQQVGLRAASLPTGHALTGQTPDATLRDLRDVLTLPTPP